MVAAAGAGPCPQITSTLRLRTSCTMTGTSPPGPLRWGSTTCSVKAVATAASKALPPFSSVAIPTAVAIQWVEVTTPKVPSISGRVVNGLGLMLLMGPSTAAPNGPAVHHTQVGKPMPYTFILTRHSGKARSERSPKLSRFRVRALGTPWNDSRQQLKFAALLRSFPPRAQVECFVQLRALPLRPEQPLLHRTKFGGADHVAG